MVKPSAVRTALTFLLCVAPAFGQRVERQLCDPIGPYQCIEDTLEVVFPEGDDLTNSIYEYDEFVSGERIDAVIVTETVTATISGFSFGVKHDGEYLTVIDDSVTTADTAVEELSVHPSFNMTHVVPGGWTTTVVFALEDTVYLPLGRNLIARASYRLDANPGAQGTPIQFAHKELGVSDFYVAVAMGVVTPDETVSGQPAMVVDGLVRDAGELNRPLCDSQGSLQCIDDTLEVVFPEGDDLTNSVYEYSAFVAEERIDTVIVTETKTSGIHGYTFAVRHDPEYLALIDDSVTTDGTVVDDVSVEPSFNLTRAESEGWVTAIVLSLTDTTAHLPLGRNPIAKASYRLHTDPGPRGARIRFVNRALVVPDTPREIEMTTTVPCQPSVVVHGLVRLGAGGRQLPGDCNQDGRLDISDAICILSVRYLGAAVGGLPPGHFPCGDGSAEESSNQELLDFNGDESSAVDVSDGIAIIQYFFFGGPPHVRGEVCLAIPGCPDGPSCP